MRLKVLNIGISSGGPLIAVMNKEDAAKMDLHVMDRIKIIKGKKLETAVLDIANKEVVSLGKIGLFSEVSSSLGIKDNDSVEILLARKPLSLEFIRKKLDGAKLSKKEINQIVWDIVHNKLSQVELTYFVAACYTNLMTMQETIMLTKAMVDSGEVLKIKRYPIIDKHCIGGIPGNRTTMIIVPIIAAAGFTIPKTSSRSITSPAGTADTMEVLANVSFPISKMKQIVEKSNGCIVWGGALNLAPADDKIIAVEKPLEIDAESQLLASIMAKKHSVSSTHILIDIPIGKSAKVKRDIEAGHLKKEFENVGRKLKKHIRVLVTDGNQPIGNGIGPSLEARDVMWVLKRDPRRPLDLEKKCLVMCSNILEMAGVKDGQKKAVELLESGKAYGKMIEIIKLQGGKEIPAEDIPLGKFTADVRASKPGKVAMLDNTLISRVARIAGAPKDKGSGMYLHKHVGDKVKKNESIFTIYSESEQKLKYALDMVRSSRVFKIK